MTVDSSVRVSSANSGRSFPYSSASFTGDCRACVRPLWTVHVCATTPCSVWSDSFSFFVPIDGVPASASFAIFLTQDALMVGKRASHACLWKDTTWNSPSSRFLTLTLNSHPSTLHAAENRSFVLLVTLWGFMSQTFFSQKNMTASSFVLNSRRNPGIVI